MKKHCALLFFTAVALAQTPARSPLDWLAGTWSVTYEDAALGPVRGQARVSVASDGWVGVQYVVVDPRDDRAHELTAFHIRHEGDVVTMELPMGGPSAATSAEGPTPAGAATTEARRLGVPAGATLRASLEGKHAEARVGTDSAVANPTLRLVRKGDRLEGEWIVRRDSASGFRGARLGKRDVELVPGPGPELRREIMRGPEVWAIPKMEVESARRSSWSDAPAGPLSGTARVAITGKNLPNTVERRSEVRFSDSFLTPKEGGAVPSQTPAIFVPVDVDRKAVPGPKGFVLADPGTGDQAPGTWVFDWPALSVKAIRFARRSLADHYEPTSIVYPGEQFHIEVVAAANDTGEARLYGIETSHPEPVLFHLVRDRSDRSLYHAGPFLLLAPDEPLPGGIGAKEPLQIPLDHQSLVTPSDAEPFVVRAELGERIRTYHIAAQPEETVAVATVDVVEEEPGDGRYQRALAKARALRKLYTDSERYQISVLAPDGRGLWQKTGVTEADHAALILLHEELAKKVAALRRPHARALSTAELLLYGALLDRAAERGAPEPLLAYTVAAPDGSSVPFREAIDETNLTRWFRGDKAKRDEHVAKTVRSGIDQLLAHLGEASTRLYEVDLAKPEELIRVVKPAYPQLAGPLVQELVRRSRPDQGEAAHPRWVPDEPGRVAVTGIARLFEAIASDEKLASFQWLCVGLITAPAYIGAGMAAAGAFAVEAAAATLAQQAIVYSGLAISAIGTLQNGIEFADTAGKLGKNIGDTSAAWDVAPVAGYGAYEALKSERSGLILATVLTGLGTAADGLGTGAVAHALRSGRQAAPTPAAMGSAIAQALEQGADSLSPAARSNLAAAIESAIDVAQRDGGAALTPLQRSALRAAFPKGIPEDVAKTLRIPPGDPDFVIRPGTSTIELPPPARVPSSAAPNVPRVAPESSSNPMIRRLYAESEETARLGVPEAQARMERLTRAAADWEALPPDARGRVQEAMETFARLRSSNPSIAAMDEAEALEYFNFHGRARIGSTDGVNRAVAPEELVAEVVAFRGRGAAVTVDALARAGNISRPNAEAALFAAEARLGRGRAPESASPFTRSRVTDPSAETAGDAPRRPPMNPEPEAPKPLTHPPLNAAGAEVRRIEIAERLKEMGVPAGEAEFAGLVPGARPGDVRVAAAAAAMNSGVPADRVMRQLGMNRQQLEPLLDDYFRRFEMAPEAQRKRMLGRFFGDPTPAAMPPPSPARAVDAPRGLEPPLPSPAQARGQVEASLERMGLATEDIKLLPIEEALAKSGSRPGEAAAALARSSGIEAPRAARALGVDENAYAGMLDRAEAGARPHVPAPQRAADVASRLEADGVTEPYTRVLRARQDSVDAALRDLGIPAGDPALTARGLDPESAIVGEALSRGVAPEVIQARRGLSPERLAYHADDYLVNGRNVRDAAELARAKTQLLARPPTEGGTTTVRLPPAVIAAENELADALELLGVDFVQAAQRASNLANLARTDAHQAIVVGAWQSRVPPSRVRDQFGVTNDQMARSLDGYLEDYLGVRDAGARRRVIAENFFTRGGENVTPDQVGAMLGRPAPPPPPLRAVANPPGPIGPPPPPPPRLPAVAGEGDELTARYGPAIPPRAIRPAERASDGRVRANPAVVEIRPGQPLNLNPGIRWLWLVDEQGRLMIGPERYVTQNGRVVLIDGDPARLGHPALIGGGRARVAGELTWRAEGGWVLTNESGRYSAFNPGLLPEHLENAADRFREAGMAVRAEFR